MENIEIEQLVDGAGALPVVLQALMLVISVLIIVAGVVALVVSIWLAIRYSKYNRKQNSVNMTGEAIARQILDENGLEGIAVKCTGSLTFGNSYSHYFKKVRLRRRTWKKASVASLAMAAQKSCLAVLDKENDPDMARRVRLSPFIYLGPIAFLPLILIGVLLDVLVFNSSGLATGIGMGAGLGFYIMAFIMSLMVLKTETKAQKLALQVVRADGLATEEEVADMQALFKMYNVQYVVNMIIALLELILRVLSVIVKLKGGSSSSSKD